MSQLLEERGNSIIETSLTELAFIFFFILLIFSAWKISDVTEQLDDSELVTSAQKETIEQLREVVNTSSEFFELTENSVPEKLFDELILGRDALIKLEENNKEIDALESTLSKLQEASENVSFEEIVNAVKELEEAKKADRRKRIR